MKEIYLQNSLHVTRAGKGYQIHQGAEPPEGALTRDELIELEKESDGDLYLGIYNAAGELLSPVPFYYSTPEERAAIMAEYAKKQKTKNI